MKGLRIRNATSHQRAVPLIFWSQALLSNLGTQWEFAIILYGAGDQTDRQDETPNWKNYSTTFVCLYQV